MPRNKRKFSKLTREKMSKAHQGKKHSPETIEKIRAARKERETLIAMGLLKPFRHSEATKKKLRKLAKGRKPSRRAILAARTARKDRAAERQAQEALRKGTLV